MGDADSARQISFKCKFAWVMSEDFRRLRENGRKGWCLSTKLEDGIKAEWIIFRFHKAI